MIGIKLDGEEEFLETKPDTSISIRLENPIFGDAEKLSPGSYSFPFDLPGGEQSPGNAQKLKNPDIIENNEAYQLQEATLFFEGVPFKKGNIRSSVSKKPNISSYFTFGLNSIHPSFKKARMQDVMNESLFISNTSITKHVFVKKNTGASVALTVNDLTFTDDDIAGIGFLINDYFSNNIGVDEDVWLPYSQLISTGNTPLGMTPLYIQIRMARRITSGGLPIIQYSTDPHINLSVNGDKSEFTIEGYIEDYYDDFDTWLSQYVGGNYPDEKIRFPVTFNASPHDDNLKENEIINAFNSSGIIKNDPNWGLINASSFQPKNYNSIQPYVLLKYVLSKIASAFSFEWEGDFYDDSEVENILIDNSVLLDLPMKFVGEKSFLFWRRNFNLNELVPDISVVDFLKMLQNRYNLAVYYNEATNRVRISKRENIIKSAMFDDITFMSSPVQAIEDGRIEGLLLVVPAEDSDLFSLEETLAIGENSEEELEITCGRIHQTGATIIENNLIQGPRVSRKSGTKFGLRVFHYAGLIDAGSFSYAVATISGPGFNEILPGLYGTFYKYWLRSSLNRRIIKINVGYKLRHLLLYDWELKRRFDRSNFIVKSISVKMTNRRLSISDVELYTS